MYMRIQFVILMAVFFSRAQGQRPDMKDERSDPAYQRFKGSAMVYLENARRAHTSIMFLSNDAMVYRQEKLIALALDLRDSTSSIDSMLTSFLQSEKIPLTVFVSGTWIASNLKSAKLLCTDTTVEVDNGGLTGAINPHADPGNWFDEIALNAIEIDLLSHRKPLFYLPSDNVSSNDCAIMACYLDEYVLRPDINVTPEYSLENFDRDANMFRDHGAVILINLSRVNRAGLVAAISTLKHTGFAFVKLERLLE